MKAETKELLEYIISHFDIRRSTERKMSPAERESAERFNDLQERAQKFLRSIPEIERKLCFGGYIQDKNGTPCCHGDKIINERIINNEKEKGVLCWSVDDRRFYCKTGGVLHSLSIDFEKVEK